MYFQISQSIYRSKTITINPKVPVSFSSGMVIRDNLDNPLVFISNFTKEKPPGHLIGSRFPVMSSILIDLLQDNGVDNLQIFPAIIWNTDKTTKWDGYFAVNIVGSLTCADLEKSEYGTITPGDGQNIPPLLVMKKLVMKKDFISNDLLFFRLKEDPLWMIAHERVFNLLKENSAPGGWGIDMDELEGS